MVRVVDILQTSQLFGALNEAELLEEIAALCQEESRHAQEATYEQGEKNARIATSSSAAERL